MVICSKHHKYISKELCDHIELHEALDTSSGKKKKELQGP